MPNATAKEYVIDAARQAGEKDNPHGGKLMKWYLDVHSLDGTETYESPEDVYTQKKPGNNLSAGEQIYGRIEKGEYGWRFFGEKQDGYSPRENGTGQSSGDSYDDGVHWGLALKLANERVCANVAPTTTDEWVKKVHELAEAILPLVEQPKPQQVQEAVQSVTTTLSAGPQKPQEAAEPSPVFVSQGQVVEASRAYLDAAGEKDTVDREIAKNKLQLHLGAIGVEDPANMTEDQKASVYAFLLAGAEAPVKKADPDDDIQF